MEIGLGTVQFGVDYGVSNSRGKTPFDEVVRILKAAAAGGVSWLDTGSMYGDSEEVLGKALRSAGGEFRIVTKTPHFVDAEISDANADHLEECFHASLRKLRRSSVEGLLLHNPQDLFKPGWEKLWQRMLALKAQGLVRKIGASVYNPQQTRNLPEEVHPDIVQLPLNFLDQRFLHSGELQRLKSLGVETHVRSIFLQGLLLLDPGRLPAYFQSVRGHLLMIQETLRKTSFEPLEAPFSWAERVAGIDVLVVGVATLKECHDTLAAAARRHEGARRWNIDIESWNCSDVSVINPTLWPTEGREGKPVVAILQARMSSSRLPGKVMLPILGRPMIGWLIERVRKCRHIDRLVVATSTERSDDSLVEYVSSLGVDTFRGSLDDVLGRFAAASERFPAQHYVRLTGDCPLADPEIIDRTIDRHLSSGADFTSNSHEPSFPDGLDTEVMTARTLRRAAVGASLPAEREHVTLYVRRRPDLFRIETLKNEQDLSEYRLTVDTPADFTLVTGIFAALSPGGVFGLTDVVRLLEQSPNLRELNSDSVRNEGLMKSVRKDELARRYHVSMKWLRRAEDTIPLGSQTFSKSRTQYPYGVSPYFIVRGKGARVWDLDANEYVDFVNSLAAVNLGYGDPDVSKAVLKQLEDGVIFSLPHPLETLVAEKMAEMIPCAQKVRFAKNGSDATAGAIRVARAFTGRDHVISCGYHGWQDWYIGATARNKGVPQSTRALTHTVPYNDIPSIEKVFEEYRGQVAALIMEPMNIAFPAPGYLESVKEITHKHGAILIFDEIVTGFRFADGGAQKLFGVIPDLATFGKGMANGHPISAVVGEGELMREMEEVFFSFTFGGETLSLAAALATMEKIQREPVTEHLRTQGKKIQEGLRERIRSHGCDAFLEIGGHPAWSFFVIKDHAPYTSWQIKTLYLQEMFARGILTLGTHNMSYAHSNEDVQRLLDSYDEVLGILKTAVGGKLERLLVCKPLEPLFKIR
jgi:glutamate-1-semialdehyde 2,1-aminomutase/spore coat polysaccharide biosynthesis protein SpsF